MAKDLKSSLLTTASFSEILDSDRRIVQNIPEAEPVEFVSNEIRTSKYSLVTWAPKSLLWQFRKAANIYFLIIAVFTFMPFSPKKPASLAITFSCVLFLTMLKEAYEDFVRHKQDRQINQSLTHRVTQSSIKDIPFQDVKVGDVLQIQENDIFPADMVLLSCAEVRGVAFINTMNLDGETNLKERIAHESTKLLRTPQQLSSTKLTLRTDKPNPSLISWNCNLQVNDGKKVPLSQSQLLLRGCTLKNTEFVYGLVVYTGHETKVMLNGKEVAQKMSNVLRKMNRLLFTVFGFQAFICFLFAAFGLRWQMTNVTEHYYLGITSRPDLWSYVTTVLTFLVAYSHLIPISLYVAMEILKLCLAYLINQDLDMYYKEDDRPASCRTSDLVEELGEVEFVFSDKTGTLTCNVMELRKCSILGKIYGGSARDESCLSLSGDAVPAQLLASGSPEEQRAIRDLFTELALCHSVFPTPNPANPLHPRYQAPSPDDLALVQASADMGFVFADKEDRKVTIRRSNGELEVWEVLAEIPFSSDRRRMSIIAKEPESGRCVLMTKGADSVMWPRMDISNEETKLASEHLHGFALEGLRTLVVAQRDLSDSEVLPWLERHGDLLLSTGKNKDIELEKHADKLETGLRFVGATAIEDKLQEGVSDSIELMMKARIRVWVLTGDKEETAIEIGKSCKLITPETELLILSSDSKEKFQRELQRHMERYKLIGATNEDLDKKKTELDESKTKVAIVINGTTLAWVFEHSLQLRRDFFKLGYISNSCICCRVSPAQKMHVVQLVKEQGPWITLSIGDGANDVSMIQEAHIGVGIAGKEGAQAVQASDFAFSQFRYLSKLLLVHGRWGYRRISVFICYYFYKNIVAVFTELWFAWFTGFSGQIFFADWLPQLYNSFWTSWPCMGTFIFEQDLNSSYSQKYPIAYQAGQMGVYFTYGQFWKWVILGIWHGVLCFWIPVLAFDGSVSFNGKDTGLWWVSTLSFTLVIHIVTYKLLMESIYWNRVNM